MATGHFSCHFCKCQQEFRAFTQARLSRKMERYILDHTVRCEDAHPTTSKATA